MGRHDAEPPARGANNAVTWNKAKI
jgi:hypothetical protein